MAQRYQIYTWQYYTYRIYFLCNKSNQFWYFHFIPDWAFPHLPRSSSSWISKKSMRYTSIIPFGLNLWSMGYINNGHKVWIMIKRVAYCEQWLFKMFDYKNTSSSNIKCIDWAYLKHSIDYLDGVAWCSAFYLTHVYIRYISQFYKVHGYMTD